MSAIHDLIAQVSDPRLRERLSAEWATASQDKKFGLVFEDHLPELLPLYGVKSRRGDLPLFFFVPAVRRFFAVPYIQRSDDLPLSHRYDFHRWDAR